MKTKAKKQRRQHSKKAIELAEMITEIATLPEALYLKYRNSGMTMEEVWELINKGKTQQN